MGEFRPIVSNKQWSRSDSIRPAGLGRRISFKNSGEVDVAFFTLILGRSAIFRTVESHETRSLRNSVWFKPPEKRVPFSVVMS